MPSIQITVPNDKGRQKFTIGEIARMILETHESSPTVKAQDVIMEIMKQAQDGGEPPVSFRHGVEPPDEEIVFVTAAGHPYKSAASAARAARTRADLQDIDWEIVSVDGGWAIRDISTYTNWFEYWADKDTLTADEISYKVLVSTANMMRLCRSTGYREWASPLGLGVPVMFGGEGTPLAKVPEDVRAQTLPPHDEPDPQEPAETPVPERSEDEPAPPRKKPTKNPRGAGRKKGSGSFAKKDEPLLEKMKPLVAGGMGDWNAALSVVGGAAGKGSDESRAKRLLARFKEWKKNSSVFLIQLNSLN